MEDQMQDAEVEYEAEVAAGVKEYGCSGVIGQAHEKVKKRSRRKRKRDEVSCERIGSIESKGMND